MKKDRAALSVQVESVWEPGGKPDSVLIVPCGTIAVIISLGPGLLRASCGLPESHGRASR